MKLRVLLILAVLAVGCAPDFVDPRLVDYLRILSMRGEPPEVAPGETLSLDALVGDPFGEGRPLSYIWALCLPDPVEGLASCDEENAVPIGFTATVDFDVPADALDGLPPEDQERGFDLFALLIVSAGEESDTALKRVRISSSSAPNQNPSFSELTIDGVEDVAVNVESGSTVEMIGTPTAASLQIYEDVVLGSISEEMRFNWYMTKGEIENIISFGDQDGIGRTTWTGQDDATIWVVLRDQRGGTAWEMRDIVTPSQ